MTRARPSLTRLTTMALMTAAVMVAPASAKPGRSGSEPSSSQLLAAVHVHSTASSGADTLPQLARLARHSGLDVLVLGENLGYQFRYAPAGLRLFGEVRATAPTLERHGIARFLEEVAEARGAEPHLLLLPGVEVPPYYYWTGSLLGGDLTLHDMQRNILLVAPASASDEVTAAFFRGIPAVGNRYHREYGIRSLALFLPGLFCVALAARMLGLGMARGREPGLRSAWRAPALLVTGALLLSVNFPFSVPSLAPYSPDTADRAAESVFSYARQNGGLGFWSMPEAVDHSDRGVGPLTVSLSTDPYPEVLARASGYTGFGGVYADTVTLWEAGNAWDEAISDFQSGRRDTAPWIFGESAFHYTGQAGKELADVVTVLFVDERTERAAFSALSGGRSYALRRDRGNPDLRLGEFSLERAKAPDSATASRPARTGQTLTIGATGLIETELVVRVNDAAGSATPVEVEIVRNGEVHRHIKSTTPFEHRWRETLAAAENGAYYRVIVRATRAAYLVSNPIFVERAH